MEADRLLVSSICGLWRARVVSHAQFAVSMASVIEYSNLGSCLANVLSIVSAISVKRIVPSMKSFTAASSAPANAALYVPPCLA